MKTNYFYYLLTACLSATLLFSCSKDNDEGSDNIEENNLVEIVSRVIRDSGLDFPQGNSSGNRGEARPSNFQMPAEDYVTIDYGDQDDNGQTITVKIWLGPNNHIIPTPDWQIANPNYCLDQGRYMLPTRKLLQFKIHDIPRDDIRVVQLNQIDVLDFNIEHSIITDYYEADPDWMYNAMSEVWDEMRSRITINGAVEPCDNRIPLTLNFSTTVTFESADSKVYEELEFSIPLQFNEAEEAFTGIGDFVWIDGWLWDKEENEYFPYPPIKRGYMEIVNLITPVLAGNSIENATMNFRVPQPSPDYSSILLIAFAEFYTLEATQDDTMEFRIDNWQLLDDPEIIMAAYINNQVTVDGAVITETTIFEIVQ